MFIYLYMRLPGLQHSRPRGSIYVPQERRTQDQKYEDVDRMLNTYGNKRDVKVPLSKFERSYYQPAPDKGANKKLPYICINE